MSSLSSRSRHVLILSKSGWASRPRWYAIIKHSPFWARSVCSCLLATSDVKLRFTNTLRQIHHVRHRLSNFWAPTGGITSSQGAEESSLSLLHRAGLVRQAQSGVFHLLPLGLKVRERLERIINREMLAIGASKVSLSSISSEAIWERSGRLAKNPELLRIADRKNSSMILSPTHEEEITAVAAGILKSYKDLPLRLFQISQKYRDELRPRQGLLRAKEFTMKDLYTFDLTAEDALTTYGTVKSAYLRIFDHLGLDYVVAEADSGNMGGSMSHEFQLLSPLGEDTVFRCGSCGHCANEEIVGSSPDHDCPKCKEPGFLAVRAIEVGHTFHLGTRYSEPLDATVADRLGKRIALQMGCHGIGVSRIIGAAASLLSTVEGLRWPVVIAPFKIVILAEKDTLDTAEQLYDVIEALAQASGYSHLLNLRELQHDDVLLDDRDKPLGWKLKDADLIGYPIALVLGSKWKKHGIVDVSLRKPRIAGGAEDTKVSIIARALQSALGSRSKFRLEVPGADVSSELSSIP